MPKFFQIIFFN